MVFLVFRRVVHLTIVYKGILGGPGITLYLLDPFTPCIIQRLIATQNWQMLQCELTKTFGW